MRRALVYSRVSTEKQATDGVSMAQQSDALLRWCAGQGVAMVGIEQDAAVSGGMPFAERPGGARIVQRCRAERIDLIVVTDLDRLFRDTLDGLRCMRETFPALGVQVLVINFGSDPLDLSTAAGKFAATVMLAKAEMDRDQTAERNRRTSQHLQRAGKVYGTTPFGCVAIAGRLYRDPAAWHTRERIVEALGRESLRAVQLNLRALRILSPNGSRTWSTSTLKTIRDSHDRLSQLPTIGDAGQGGSVAYGAPEAVVSPIRGARHA